jgi:lysophospholipase L1-like esterase
LRYVILLFGLISLPLKAELDSLQVCLPCNEIQQDSSLALLSTKWESGDLKVLHLGDSHVQIGHFSGEIKRLLQAKNAGIHFPYPLAKSVDGRLFKTKASGNWTGISVLKPASGVNIGLTGYAVSTRDTAAKIQWIAKDSLLSFKRVRIWTESDSCAFQPYLGSGFIQVNQQQNGRMRYYDFESASSVSQFILSLRNIGIGDQFILHGIELPAEENGIDYIDLGVSGAQFTHVKSRANLVFDQIKILQPDLIICSFGTNEAYNANWESQSYKKAWLEFIQEIQIHSPKSVFLLTSPPDTRSQNRVPKYQQEVIRVLSELKVPFYDLNAAMGGFGSSLDWVKNGCFLKDQLHLTKEGYQLQAKLFALALFKTWGDQASYENLQNQVNQHIISVGIPK